MHIQHHHVQQSGCAVWVNPPCGPKWECWSEAPLRPSGVVETIIKDYQVQSSGQITRQASQDQTPGVHRLLRHFSLFCVFLYFFFFFPVNCQFLSVLTWTEGPGVGQSRGDKFGDKVTQGKGVPYCRWRSLQMCSRPSRRTRMPSSSRYMQITSLD